MKKIVLTVLLAVGYFVSVAAMQDPSSTNWGDASGLSTPPESPQLGDQRVNQNDRILQQLGLSQEAYKRGLADAYSALESREFEKLKDIITTNGLTINSQFISKTEKGIYVNTLLSHAIQKYHVTDDKKHLAIIRYLIKNNADYETIESIFIDKQTGKSHCYTAATLAKQLGVNNDIANYLKQ